MVNFVLLNLVKKIVKFKQTFLYILVLKHVFHEHADVMVVISQWLGGERGVDDEVDRTKNITVIWKNIRVLCLLWLKKLFQGITERKMSTKFKVHQTKIATANVQTHAYYYNLSLLVWAASTYWGWHNSMSLYRKGKTFWNVNR